MPGRRAYRDVTDIRPPSLSPSLWPALNVNREIRRFWRSASMQLGMDISYGMLEKIQQAFGFSALELESPEELLLDARLPETAGGPGKTDEEAATVRAIETSEAFRALDDGSRSVFVSWLGGRHVSVTNDLAKRTFMSSADFQHFIFSYRLIPVMLAAR